ncbi:MAG TPA: APC family permease [Geobacteraceae bacterium]|nr:APC family permease [Geobacteraceae bacterium]
MQQGDGKQGLWRRIRVGLFGRPKKIRDPSLFHKLSLIPVLAWVGLGADGLSSSSYGPPEAFAAIQGHTYLCLALGLATAFTVVVISYAYTRLIEHFPHGGGGYIVATHVLGPPAGVLSGSALILDYILCITISIAACVDAVFSFLPLSFQEYKLLTATVLLVLLIVLNVRGVKESVMLLAPIFIVFIGTHLLLFAAMANFSDQVGAMSQWTQDAYHRDVATIGRWGILLIFLRAYSLGGGTYTGLEAVSNGLQIMREPKVQTAGRTMVYMAASLALTAGGLFFCYVLAGVSPAEGKTLNAALAEKVFAPFPAGGALALLTLLSEGALLLVGAQTGFIDGPRVMANMAVDSWLPHRFSALSDRLTMHNGVALIGGAALLLLWYTKGSVSALVVMFSINVFITFSLSQVGMARYFIRRRREDRQWLRHLAVFLVAGVLCVTILVITIVEKFAEGGWLTLLITGILVALCYVIRQHYTRVGKAMRELDEMLMDIPLHEEHDPGPPKPAEPTAILLVTGYNGFGVHMLLTIVTSLGKCFTNMVFVSVAVIDSGSFKGVAQLDALERSAKESLEKYVALAKRLGFRADYRMEIGTEVVETATMICQKTNAQYPNSTVFSGQLVFPMPQFYHLLLHNQTSFAIQRRLQWEGIKTMILTVRVRI